MFVNTSASWLVHTLSGWPGTLSGPGDLRGLKLLNDLLTSLIVDSVRLAASLFTAGHVAGAVLSTSN